MTRPFIGVSCDVCPNEGTVFVYRRYVAAIQQAEGLPVLIPPLLGSCLGDVVQMVDGVLIPGGDDISAEQFGAVPRSSDVPLAPLRDASDRELLKVLEDVQKPALGICYGMQRMCVARGGSLYQHLPDDLPGGVAHARGTHAVQLSEDGPFRGILGGARIETPTAHHQGVREPGAGILACGVTADGNIEAIASDDGLWWGVQWHVEMDPGTRRIIDAFVQKCLHRRAVSSTVEQA